MFYAYGGSSWYDQWERTMSMQTMMRDRVTLVKPDGARIPDIRCVVSRDSVITDNAALPLEEGDHFERKLPSGLTEVYLVLDRGFYQGMQSIPDHYQAKVRKLSTMEVEHRYRSPSVIVHGPNSRVNIHSTDSSTNVVRVDESALFDQLVAVIGAAVDSRPERTAIAEAIGEMRRAQDQATLLAAYQRFITSAANHMTVIAPFLPALAKLVAG